MKQKRIRFLTQSGIIAALYIVLTMLCTMMGLSSGAIQIRFSEALCILPCFTPAAIPGLLIGCLISNILSGCAVWDVIFGSLATLIGAVGTYMLRHHRVLASLPPIISNILIVPFVISWVYGSDMIIPMLMLTVGIGEIISCGVLGQILYTALEKRKAIFKKSV